MIRPARPGAVRTLAFATSAVLAACGGGKDPSGPGPQGTLDIQVSGLPAGAAARVTLVGPDGLSRAVTLSGLLGDLAPGAYIATARYVIAQNQTWNPLVSTDTFDVTAGDTVVVPVAYTAAPLPTVNYGIAGYMLMQSVQRADNSIPMVAQRAAFIRVFATASAANTTRAALRIRLYSAGIQVDSIDVLSQAASVPQTVDTASLGFSLNAFIPATRVVSGLSFSAELDPDDAIPETDKTDNRYPASGTTPVLVQSARHLDLRFVPVHQSVNGLTGAVNAANKGTYSGLTERMMPLGTTAVDVRAPFSTAAPALDANDNNGGWSQILSETNSLRVAEGAVRNYLGIVAVTYGGGIAGLGYIGLPAAVSWDKSSSAAEVIAHELGHNFGRNHAPCGNPGGVDAQFPHAGGGIGVWGIDLGLMQLRSPATYKDLMGYCNPDWISDYTYLGVLGWRGAGPAVEAARAPAGPGLLVWGRVVQGNVVLEPAFEVDAPAVLPSRAGPHRVEGYDGSGARLFGISFEGDAVGDLPRGEERHFAFVVPLSRSELTRLASLRLVGQGLTAQRLGSAALRSGPPSTRTVSVRAAGAATRVRWNPAYPLAVIRDSANGEILGYARGGVGSVESGGRAVRVELSDGVASAPGAVLP
jgi:hypothetical protein